MSRSTLGDTDILKLTKFSPPDSKGRVQLNITLPSGRVIKSTDWLVPSELKGKVLITWAASVREQDSLDIAEREEQDRLKADARRSGGKPSGVQPEEAAPAGDSTKKSFGTGTPTLPDDPGEMIKDKLTFLLKRAGELDKIIYEHTEQLRETHTLIAKWTKVADGLGIELSPSSDVPSNSSEGSNGTKTIEEPEPHTSGNGGDTSTDGGARDSKGSGGRGKRGPRAKRSAKRDPNRDSSSSSEAVKHD